MRTTKLLTLLALLITAATGAWAQSTTHIVNQDNVNTIFNGGGYTLGDAVKAGDVLDFQGEIDLQHSLIVNKQVTIKSTTKDAVVKLNTPSNVMTSAYTATVMYPQSFVINKAGSGTTVQDIRIENTETWIFNTSNVTFTGVTMWVEEARVGAGVGHVALRYSDHITFDGCTVYTKNNGGTSACVLTGSHDCTFRNSRFEKEGSVGNILYIGNPYNGDDKPADYTMNNDNISVINCTITAESSGAMSQFKIMDGLRHRIENCTVNFITSFSCAATASEDGFVIRNNTFTKGLTVPKASTFTGNSVTGNVTINANSATVNSTTVYLGSTITGNTINGTVTFSTNSKNNTLTRNVITSTGDYAVVMASTADANNTVQYNTLNAATKKGDEAVNPSTGTGNTISNNSNIALMLADGTKDAANWTAKVGEGDAQPLPVAGLNEGNAVTLQYTGRLKVKGVKATSDAVPAAKPAATVTTVPMGAAVVVVGKTTELVSGGAADGGTLMYAVTTTNTKPTSTAGFSASVPTAQTITASGKVYVWYYVKGDDTHSDSEIAATAIEVPVADIVWDGTNISDLRVRGTRLSYTKEGVTLSAKADQIEARWRDHGDESGISFEMNESGGYTFTAPTGQKFTKIEMTLNGSHGWEEANLGTEWAINADMVKEILTVTWTGNAATTVDLLKGASSFNGESVKSIAFYLSE